MILRTGDSQPIEPEQFGPALEWLRTRSRLTIHEAAERADLSAGLLSGYENGAKAPSLRNLTILLDVYQTDYAGLQEALVFLCLRPPPKGPGLLSIGEPTSPRARDLELFGQVFFGTTRASKATRQLLHAMRQYFSDTEKGGERRAEAGAEGSPSESPETEPLAGPGMGEGQGDGEGES